MFVKCNPVTDGHCCSHFDSGECGDTAEHCTCEDCVDYARINREWEESGGTQMWRYDGRCGIRHTLPDGVPGQCNPDGINPCCDQSEGKCGNTSEHCDCKYCTDFKRILAEWKESEGTQKWRYDGRCGKRYPLPDGTTSQCDPDGETPCCDQSEGQCGNTSEHCDCKYCIDFKRIHTEWKESEGTQKWRYDERCGERYPLPDGTPSQCDPDGETPCCSTNGWCGSNCFCQGCIDYKLLKEWKESKGTQRWRSDGRCGYLYRLPDGSPVQCDPYGDKPCCNDDARGWCGNTSSDCGCYFCTDYRRVYKDWKDSNGTVKWIYKEKCGTRVALPDGKPAQCNPGGRKPCCNEHGVCISGDANCFCPSCIDYRLYKTVKESGKNCSVAKLSTGFLQDVCFDDITRKQFFKCALSSTYYTIHYLRSTKEVSSPCKNDIHFYQACGLHYSFNYALKITTKSDVLCGGYICDQKTKNNGYKYIECSGEQCESKNRDCTVTREGSTLCDDKCDELDCIDESFCNGYTYGITCSRSGEVVNYHPNYICDGSRKDCDDVVIKEDCTINEETPHTCIHYYSYLDIETTLTVPIRNNTRCSVIDTSIYGYPYCLDYLDQTNCSDIQRVGGYCKINGFMSSVSKFILCIEFDRRTDLPIKICDDDAQNNCIYPSTSDCRVHKHWMCDGVEDCPDGADEIHDMCAVTTDDLNFSCERLFRKGKTIAPIPLSWIMDNEKDCMNGEDENEANWVICEGENEQILLPGERCQNAHRCPGERTSFVSFDQLCDGLESCGDGAEDNVCRIARDFPKFNKTIQTYNGKIRNICDSSIEVCEVRELERKWGDIFGVTKIELSVPTSKVNCSNRFGEEYFFLSCMNLCKEKNAKCPYDHSEMLAHDSCTGQYADRAYTVANNSYVTFVEMSENGQYHQNFYQCHNSRCVDYKQVCDLVDDCGDMSDEINCANHMICEDSLNSTKHQFISLQQKCDGIYDCFDLSDECNDSCTKHILENWFLKIFCWIMGILAVSFNLLIVIRGITSFKDCTTEGMMTSKVLMTLIGSGDFLIGLYLVLLSVYDSIVFGSSYCRNQAEWLTGAGCLALGVISTIGSQVSLFTMTVMSCIRIHGIRSMKIPGPVNKKAVGRISLLVSMILFATFSVAFIPLLPQLEDYFVQGMYYDPDYKVFIGFPTKDKHVKVLETYYEQGNISSDLSWSDIGEKVDGMFTQDHGTLSRKPVHFYGNDGVCLFKYFVRTDDARRSRQSPGSGAKMSDPVVWTMLAVNLICFSIITICYTAITLKTRQSVQDSGQQDDPARIKKVRAIQRKIMMIIATDFLCWVPFIFISGLHNLQYIDASSWYATFAMIVLPFNSVINPLIYDVELKEILKKRFGRVTRRYVIRGNLTKFTQVQSSRESKEQDRVRMKPVSVKLPNKDN